MPSLTMEHQCETLVIGAGPAGLAVGACLRRRGVPLKFLEPGTCVLSGPVAHDGLYFCGFRISPTGMLRDIGIEARRIANEIARKKH